MKRPARNRAIWGVLLVLAGAAMLIAALLYLLLGPAMNRETASIHLLALLGIGTGAACLYEGIQVLRGKQTISME